MADNRILTFLKLCELMNYRKTAEELNMTQPAVTQHIHYLEEEYGCRLFSYNGRVLSKTEECFELEKYSRSMLYNEIVFKKSLLKPHAVKLAIGATKTIGDYTIEKKLLELLKRDDIDLELIVDNTENLLARLNSFKLDILLIEGFIDKNSYGHELIKNEELLGICSPEHRFAGKEVPLQDIFSEHIILREEGSGTRAVFEDFLKSKGYTNKRFKKKSQISSFNIIEKAVSENCGISFVYESIVKSYKDIAFFRIKDERIYHEFNFVFLKNTDVKKYLDILK